MKNILILGHGYNPPFVDLYNQYARAFSSKNTKVTIAYLVGKPKADVKTQTVADEVIFLNCSSRSVRGLKLGAIKKLLRLCRRNQYQVVICHRYKPMYLMVWVSLFCRIPKLIAVMHALKVMKRISRKLFVFLIARHRCIFAGVSKAVAKDLANRSWGMSENSILVLPNSIDIPTCQQQLLSREEARRQLNLPKDTFVFGNIGRLTLHKDQETLLRAFADAAHRCPDAKLVIIGGGKLEDRLQKIIAESNLEDCVIMTGLLTNAFRYMRAFDVYVSSSIQEAFGMVFLEAMVAKLPIISTNVDGIAEVVGSIASLVKPKDCHQLSQELRSHYKMLPEELVRLGEKGYQRVLENFSTAYFTSILHKMILGKKDV